MISEYFKKNINFLFSAKKSNAPISSDHLVKIISIYFSKTVSFIRSTFDFLRSLAMR